MNKYDVIGLMSGTSLDGLDIAYVEFIYDQEWKFNVIQCLAVDYNQELSTKLKQAHNLSGLDLKKLDILYGKWLGENVRKFMDFYHISPDLIVSHGHTIFHQPDIGLTYQIGDGNQILKATGIKTICDLRSLDVALGGQGAPLVPIGDKLLFDDYELCLNLGGFSNISFDKNHHRTAYDICPVNTVLNYLANKANQEYDKDGELARSGVCHSELLQKLNLLEFYNQPPPKSLGIEWVHHNIFPLIDADTPENLLNTFSRHVAHQIISSVNKNFNLNGHKSTPKMFVTGGGAKNNYLIDLIKEAACEKVEIIIPKAELIDFKEAIIFAFLGLLRSLGKTNTLKSVTGATKDSSGGIIHEYL